MTADPNGDSQWYSEETATFGDRLAGAREEVGLSQQELAARLGVLLDTVQDWENDLNDPRANKLQMLSGILNVSIAWLLTGEGDGLSQPGNAAPKEVQDILDRMREVRTQLGELTTELGTLEGQLRASLKA